MKYFFIIFMAVFVVAGFAYFYISEKDLLPAAQAQESGKKGKKNKKNKKDEQSEKGGQRDDTESELASSVQIKVQNDLPEKLREVSGLCYIDKDRFACVQDEDGVLFIYNTVAGKIEKEIPFGPRGDYEGVAIVGNTAYVARSDGKLFEITNAITGKPAYRQYSTPLTAGHDVEGLFYDKGNNRLLLAIKGNEPDDPGFKGIYQFDLQTMKLVNKPLYKIDLQNELFASSGSGKKKKNKGISPSGIARHPSSNELYVVDGRNSKLLVMDATGNIRKLYSLSKAFEQPEGISFSPQGDMFISNEGVSGPGNIMQVVLQ